MEGKRLIVPARPHHHKRRAAGLFAVGLLAVVGAWALQMQVTFSEFAARQPDETLAQTASQFGEGLEELKPSEEAIVEMGAFAESIKAAIQASQQTTVATPESSTETEAPASGEGTVAAFPPAAPEGVVAGEQTEASN